MDDNSSSVNPNLNMTELAKNELENKDNKFWQELDDIKLQLYSVKSKVLGMESGIKPQISRNEYSNSVNKAIKDDYSSINTQHRAMRPKKVPEHQIPNGLIPKKQSGVMEIDISFPSLPGGNRIRRVSNSHSPLHNFHKIEHNSKELNKYAKKINNLIQNKQGKIEYKAPSPKKNEAEKSFSKNTNIIINKSKSRKEEPKQIEINLDDENQMNGILITNYVSNDFHIVINDHDEH